MTDLKLEIQRQVQTQYGHDPFPSKFEVSGLMDYFIDGCEVSKAEFDGARLADAQSANNSFEDTE